MKNLTIFNTDGFSSKQDLCKTGNTLFKKMYLDKKLFIEHDGKKMQISFSPTSKVSIPQVSDELFFRFAHLSSINKDEAGHSVTGNSCKYDLYPCTNDLNTCSIDCCENFFKDFKENKKERMICEYRMSKVHWVKEIIERLNSGEKIKLMQSSRVPGRAYYLKYVKIYFESKKLKTKFSIVFEKKKQGDKFILYFQTAFPLVLKTTIKQYDEEYSKTKIKKEELFLD